MSPDEDREVGGKFRSLPAIDRITEVLHELAPPKRVTAAARRAVEKARHEIHAGGDAPSFDSIVETARNLLQEEERRLLHPVINATGVLIHTNLGRAPLGSEQLAAVAEVASGYSNLEYDLTSGSRGDRYSHARSLLTALTGAESALVVNNNAAAVLLALAALCRGREVIVSRGELIEIGGEFRVPDVMSTSGARLVEVGTTNRTHLSDYERAIGPETAAIMKVHPSNYQVVGFTASVAARDLARVATEKGIHLIHDLGSGYVGGSTDHPLARHDPPVDVALEDGADLVTFSGDKLLGGPQSGIVVGKKTSIDLLARHPLLRALRVDKMTLAALEATLRMYLEGRARELPLWRMAGVTSAELEGRARALVDSLGDIEAKVEAVPSRAVAGGGSLPGTEMPSWAVSVAHEHKPPDELARALRFGDPAVIARIEEDKLLLDLRTVPPELDDRLRTLLLLALQE